MAPSTGLWGRARRSALLKVLGVAPLRHLRVCQDAADPQRSSPRAASHRHDRSRLQQPLHGSGSSRVFVAVGRGKAAGVVVDEQHRTGDRRPRERRRHGRTATKHHGTPAAAGREAIATWTRSTERCWTKEIRSRRGGSTRPREGDRGGHDGGHHQGAAAHGRRAHRQPGALLPPRRHHRRRVRPPSRADGGAPTSAPAAHREHSTAVHQRRRRRRRRSYGSVHKAVHNRTGTVVAIKIVPIENDLQDIVREVNVMNGLASEYIVNLYGSYLKDANLWVRRCASDRRPRRRLPALTARVLPDDLPLAKRRWSWSTARPARSATSCACARRR